MKLNLLFKLFSKERKRQIFSTNLKQFDRIFCLGKPEIMHKRKLTKLFNLRKQMWIGRKIAEIMIHHPFLCLIFPSKSKWQPTISAEHTMISDKIRIFSFYKVKKSDCFPKVKTRDPNSKELFYFSKLT